MAGGVGSDGALIAPAGGGDAVFIDAVLAEDIGDGPAAVGGEDPVVGVHAHAVGLVDGDIIGVADDLDFLLGDFRHVEDGGELGECFLGRGLHFGGAELEGEVGLEADHAEAFVKFEEVGVFGGEVAEGAIDGFRQSSGVGAEGEELVIFLLEVGELLGEEVAFLLEGADAAGAGVHELVHIGELGFELGDAGAGGVEVVFGLSELGTGLVEGGLEAFVLVHGDAAGGGGEEESEDHEREEAHGAETAWEGEGSHEEHSVRSQNGGRDDCTPPLSGMFAEEGELLQNCGRVSIGR